MPTVSHSWKASLPIRCVGTCPVMHDDRDRIHQRVGEAGDRVGGAGTRGHQHAADLAGRARIAFGGVHRALLVAHQDVLDLLLLEQRVIDRQHRAARIAEDVLDALIGERLDHHFGAGHFSCVIVRSITQLAVPLAISENQKGAEKPLFRAPPHRGMALATPGDAPSYEYQRLSNKIAHVSPLSAFRCAYIRTARAEVKPKLKPRTGPKPRRIGTPRSREPISSSVHLAAMSRKGGCRQSPGIGALHKRTGRQWFPHPPEQAAFAADAA